MSVLLLLKNKKKAANGDYKSRARRRRAKCGDDDERGGKDSDQVESERSSRWKCLRGQVESEGSKGRFRRPALATKDAQQSRALSRRPKDSRTIEGRRLYSVRRGSERNKKAAKPVPAPLNRPTLPCPPHFPRRLSLIPALLLATAPPSLTFPLLDLDSQKKSAGVNRKAERTRRDPW